MIIGRGMMAKAFDKYREDERVLIFASGVSDSREEKHSEFMRERKLLEETVANYPDSIFVYFGTCSVYDSSAEKTAYVRHKLEMEEYIRKNLKKFYILRLPQVVGATGSPTLVNFLFNKINSGERFDVWENATRNLIDSEDVAKIACYLIDNGINLNETVNIAAPKSYPVADFIEIIEKLLNKKAVYEKIPKGNPYFVDTSAIIPFAERLGVSFGEGYNEKIIRKYYLK